MGMVAQGLRHSGSAARMAVFLVGTWKPTGSLGFPVDCGGGGWGGGVLLGAQFLNCCLLFITTGWMVTEATLGPAAVTAEKGVCPAPVLLLHLYRPGGMCRATQGSCDTGQGIECA